MEGASLGAGLQSRLFRWQDRLLLVDVHVALVLEPAEGISDAHVPQTMLIALIMASFVRAATLRQARIRQGAKVGH